MMLSNLSLSFVTAVTYRKQTALPIIRGIKKLPKVFAVYTPVQLICVFYDEIILNIVSAVYNKMSLIIWKYGLQKKYCIYIFNHAFCLETFLAGFSSGH